MRTIVTAALTLVALAPGPGARFPDPVQDIKVVAAGTTETAVLAGGCFWGVEAVFDRLAGVKDVVSGFAGGSAQTAHYEIVSLGTTGHAESVKITYDPAKITYGQLLKIFFAIAHDPTEINRQGPDEGTQYRSAIFYGSREQQTVAEAYIRQVNGAKIFPKPIATTVVPLEAFYPAEEYHQHFLDRNPTNAYIVWNDLPKLDRLKKEFPQMLKAKRP